MKEITLETLRSEFDTWRGSRDKQGPIPDRLWSLAVEACKFHSVPEVCEVARINHSKLRMKQRSCKASKKELITVTQLNVEASIPKVLTISHINGWRVEINPRDEACFAFALRLLKGDRDADAQPQHPHLSRAQAS